MEVSECMSIEHEADVGAVRRRLTALAATAGLDEHRTSDAALIATELAANVKRHAGHGGALLGAETGPGRCGVTIAAWDRGPGMDVEACLRDGMSTAGTAGVGLGAVSRLATRWDAYAPRGGGTVIVAHVLPAREAPRPRLEVGAVRLPYPGLVVCGDAWDLHAAGDVATLIACDGLGHGDGAAAAARAVIDAFRERPGDAPAAILERAGHAARPTRGAAATVVRLDLAARTATIAGIGNVAAWISSEGAQRQLVTQHGTLGHAMPRLREERYPFPAGAALVLASDGLKSRIELGAPGMLARHPAVAAAALWRDYNRGRDDATVVVVREAR